MTHDTAELPTKMRDAVRAHWKAFLIEGILLVVFGLAAIIVPPAASLAVTILLGWLFLISGIAGLALTFWAREMPGFWWSLISAALAVLAGIVLLAQPAQGTLTLTIVVGAYLLADRGSDGPVDCNHYHHRIAGVGAVGDRPLGRHQPVIWRRDLDRRGARRTQRLIANIRSPLSGHFCEC